MKSEDIQKETNQQKLYDRLLDHDTIEPLRKKERRLINRRLRRLQVDSPQAK